MSDFYKIVKKICDENKKVALFIDMDGTVDEYIVYPEGTITTKTKGIFLNKKPIYVVIEELRKINNIQNIDLYILSLSTSNIIVKEKEDWLKKYIDFIEEKNWIIINKEKGEYNKETRNYIKAEKIKEKLKNYDCTILLDDDHKILKQTQEILKEKCYVFHVSSAIV